jgi:hypothetical protein
MSNEVKPGVETSELAVVKSSKFFAYFSVIAALFATYGPQVLGWLPEGGKPSYIVGAVIAGVAVVAKLFVELGYIKSRTDVKNNNAK